MPDYEYRILAHTAKDVSQNFGELFEEVLDATPERMEHYFGRNWEIVSHSVTQLDGQLVLSLLCRGPKLSE